MFNIKPASDQRPVFLGLFVHSEQLDKVIQGSNYSKINQILISLSDMCERLNFMNPFTFKRFLCPCLKTLCDDLAAPLTLSCLNLP